MINSIVATILKIILYILGMIATLITMPVYVLLQALFPDLSTYLTNFNVFLVDYVVRGLAFAREVFLNVTGFPRPLFRYYCYFIFR